jgi:hypothetical protein
LPRFLKSPPNKLKPNKHMKTRNNLKESNQQHIKKQKRLAPSVCTLAVMAAALAFSFAAQAYQGMPVPTLHVNGRFIQDPSGKTVLLHGWHEPCWSGFNGGAGVNYNDPSDYTSPSNVAGELNFHNGVADIMSHTGSLYGQSHGWYASFVRFVADNGPGSGLTPGWGTDGLGLVNQNQFNGWMNNMVVPFAQHCAADGLYVVLLGTPGTAHGSDGTHNMTYQYQQYLITYWTAVASNPNIKNAPNIIFEICNEPISIETSFGANNWGSGSAAYWQAIQSFMQPIVNAIRNTGANNIILVPALSYESDITGWASYPISGSNIGYSAHLYPGWWNVTADNPTPYLTGYWKPCADKYPVVITEMNWGWDSGSGTTSGFGNAVKSFADSEGNMSFVAGMLGDNLGNLSAGLNNSTLSGNSIGAGQAAFAWWPTYTWAAPTSGGGASGGAYKLIARHSGKALDATGQGTANGTQIEQWTYGGGANQKWTINSLGSGLYSITGVQSGKCIDISASGTANGTKVQLWDYVGGSNQKYSFTATDSGYFRITPSHATSSCLDVSGVSTSDGALVQLWAYGGGQNQQWLVQPVDGTVKLVARHSGKALDAYGAQTANGTQMIQWTYGGGANQQWTVTDTGSGNYKIIGVQSGRAVDVSNSGTANGTKVQLWDYYGNTAQLYKFTGTDPGYFRITPNCATSSCLDVSGVSTADGANVQLWQWLSGSNQQWASQAP